MEPTGQDYLRHSLEKHMNKFNYKWYVQANKDHQDDLWNGRGDCKEKEKEDRKSNWRLHKRRMEKTLKMMLKVSLLTTKVEASNEGNEVISLLKGL